MRPTKHSDSPLSAPLNRILRTEAAVRVLRALSLTLHPLGRSEVALRAWLDPSGVRRVLKELEELGIVESVGAGGAQPVRLRMAHPLVGSLRALFRAEASRAEAVIADVQRAAASVSPPPNAVWMIHPAPSHGLEALQIGVLASPVAVDAAAQVLRNELNEMERREDLVVEVRGYTAADLAVLSGTEREALSSAVPVLGLAPESFFAGESHTGTAPRVRDHADLDTRALAIARAVGERIVRDPTLIERAQKYVREYLTNAPSGERKEMEEWAAILEKMPPARMQKFLVDKSERATRLRQSLPFLGALTPTERTTLLHAAFDDEKSAGARDQGSV